MPLGGRIKAKRGTRWKRPEDPENTGLEADASFYIGANAERSYAAAEKGGKAAEVFEAATPPDLVIGVEATYADRDRPDRYAVLGVTEMWRASLSENGCRVEVEILDLQAPGGPRPVDTSLMLAGLGAAFLPEAIGMARLGRHDALEELLATALSQMLGSGGEDSGTSIS